MYKVIFLILNYRNVDETIKCITSIKNNIMGSWKAVIVDNGSKDGSLEKLQHLYCLDESVEVLESKENVGFSKGNNLGYKYIREKYNPKYIIVTNNDVLFLDRDMLEKLDQIYSKTHFFVMGPDIYVRKNKEQQSPIRLSMPTIEEMKKELSMYEYYNDNPEKWVKRRKIQRIKNYFCQKYKIINNIYCKLRKIEEINRNKVYENVCIQGACIIVSKDFVEKEEKMFTPESFLYCEELLLLKKCLDCNYKIIYNPMLRIYHEDSATMEKINKNAIEKAKFTLPHHIAARKLVIDVMCEGGEKK